MPACKPNQFPEERSGWEGYIEWERYPERKAEAQRLLREKPLAPMPEFAKLPLPSSNPTFSGDHWKSAYAALGLQSLVEQSSLIVGREKPDAAYDHILDFPFSGQTLAAELVKSKITPNIQHFVRNHGGIPIIDAAEYSLEVCGLVERPVTIKLADLKDPQKFTPTEITVTIQCSGNRRLDQLEVQCGDGAELPWGNTAIGTARYKGVSVRQLIERACGGLLPEAEHVEFIGADTGVKQCAAANYAVSIPWRKARMDEEVLLAWEMNGEPLPRIHGFPLRVVVAGYIGARSCKWLTRINLRKEPSLGVVQRKCYLYYPSQVGKHNADYQNGFSIQAMPISSAILLPKSKQTVIHHGQIELQGWAYSGNGNWIERVEVSPDGGRIWYPVKEEDMSEKHYHAWRIWKTTMPLDVEGWVELSVRAWDSACNTQPTETRAAWNWAMHVTSAVQHVMIYSVNAERAATRARLEQLKACGATLDPITRPLAFPLQEEQAYLEHSRKYPREPKE